jgi:hypothetical protein
MWTADSRCTASDSHRDEAVAAGIQKGIAPHRSSGRPAERATGVSGYHRIVRQSQLVGQGRVTDAMDRCRYLIVVLSPRAAGSEWVDKEVGYWLEHRAPHQLLIVVAEGQLHWDEATQRFAPIAPTSPCRC